MPPVNTNNDAREGRLFTVPVPGAELKVLLYMLYIMRRTFGFKRAADAISLSPICKSRKGNKLLTDGLIG